ncbi:DNA/RNA non-specific endonuclease [Microcoleus sp. N9_A1]|uniref:DNA/RNA non-specific endonuclease n=1 Tax=Microcoleus sp. N9_A1 TaxID=3055380 RepID=UPI0040407C14
MNRSWIGTADRQDNFCPDDAFPAPWYKVRPSDKTGSGYNRGHIAPSADGTHNQANNHTTFLTSNMMPQMPELNRRVWGDLHKSCCN